MSRFEQEWAIVPLAAQAIAVGAALTLVLFIAWVFLGAPLSAGEPLHLPQVVLFFVAAVLGAVVVAVFVLLVGYIWADAGRRGMNRLLWVLLAIFIPNAIGIILYFILREPVLVPCPACGTPAARDQAFCARCGAAVRRACPRCRQPVGPGWTHCGHCGSRLGDEAPAGA
jgi:hypothetical protein